MPHSPSKDTITTVSVIIVVGLIILGIGFYSWKYPKGSRQFPSTDIVEQPVEDFGIKDISDMTGRELSEKFCITCHIYPEPDLLPKKSWNFLLTYMGLRLGIDDESYLGEITPVEKQVMETRRSTLGDVGLIPELPVLSDEAWKKLREYYMMDAPEKSLPQANKPAFAGIASLFKKLNHNYDFRGAVTTMSRVDSANQQILIGDSLNQNLTVLNKRAEVVTSYETINAFWVDAIPMSGGLFVLSVGDVAGAFPDEKLGKIAYGSRSGNAYNTEGFVLENLYRPTDMHMADMNNDGVSEMLVCCFGDEGGEFSIYEWDNTIRGFSPTPISTLYRETGPMKCGTHDFNGDGLLDIVLMVSDVREQISLFLNKGSNEYEKKTIFETHPAWGYIGMQLVDVNRDGHMDIITGNGDNVDSDPYNTLKPYHGVRVYLNDGKLNFSEEFFYPMYGTFQVHAHDYDMDGDIDIAANAFYPNYGAEKVENFVYLEQTGPMQFIPKYHPATESGRWMSMDAGDLDGDGDIDIVLGGTYVPVGVEETSPEKFKELVEKGSPLLVLENQVIK